MAVAVLLAVLVAAVSHPTDYSAFKSDDATVSSDDVSFSTCLEANCSGPPVVRSLTEILFERLSVKDFGAAGCSITRVDPVPAGGQCPDDTAAFARALHNSSSHSAGKCISSCNCTGDEIRTGARPYHRHFPSSNSIRNVSSCMLSKEFTNDARVVPWF